MHGNAVMKFPCVACFPQIQFQEWWYQHEVNYVRPVRLGSSIDRELAREDEVPSSNPDLDTFHLVGNTSFNVKPHPKIQY